MTYDKNGIHKERPCDCLNDCGDDPWLYDGRSLPCNHKQEMIDLIKRRKEEQERLINNLQTLHDKLRLKVDKQTILNAINQIKGG